MKKTKPQTRSLESGEGNEEALFDIDSLVQCRLFLLSLPILLEVGRQNSRYCRLTRRYVHIKRKRQLSPPSIVRSFGRGFPLENERKEEKFVWPCNIHPFTFLFDLAAGKLFVVSSRRFINYAFSSFLLSSAGKSMAVKYGVKYIETSPGINHNVDELLVGVLAQIELREKCAMANSSSLPFSSASASPSSSPAKPKFGGFKVMNDLLERVWKGSKEGKTKSCGNLHVL